MSIELLVMVYMFFRRHRGLYFWSIVVSSLAIILQTTGFILLRFENDWPPVFVFVMSKIGWAANVTAFSLVLWSRLHLVVHNPFLLKAVLAMIITTAIFCIGSTTVFEFALANTKYRQTFYPAIGIVERFQQTMYSLQESIIASMYIHYTTKFWNSGYSLHTRKVVSVLVCIVPVNGLGQC